MDPSCGRTGAGWGARPGGWEGWGGLIKWTPAMKEFRKCRRCGKEFDETNDMIFHMKKEHVNFVKKVQNGLQTMASKRKNPKSHNQQRDCEYFEALAVQLNTADVC